MQPTRAIVLLADGSRYDVFSDLLKEGRLPNISKYILEKGSFMKAVTAFPSTTGPAHIPFLTGELPATCNVPGIRWFDKGLYSAKGHGSMLTLGAHGRYRSYVGLETFRINSDIRNDIKSIFEILPRSYCIFNSINKGVGDRNLTKIMRIWYWYYGHMTDRWDFVDKSGLRKILKAINKDFDFIFTVLPGIDEFSHLDHPRSEYALKQYDFLDSAVGRICAKLQSQGRLDDTLIWIVSDHGLSATHTHFCINTFLENKGIKTFYYPLIYRKGCDAASMVSGNGMSHLYFRDIREDGLKGWRGRMDLETLEELYPYLLKELLNEPAVDVLAMTDRDKNVIAVTKRGTAKFRMTADDIYYEELEGNPFGYKFPNLPAKFTNKEILERTVDSDYPDLPYQLAHIFTSPRCGDLIISATPGYDLRLKYEHPEHKGSHGSLHREHMLVPLLCNRKIFDEPLRTIDVFKSYFRI